MRRRDPEGGPQLIEQQVRPAQELQPQASDAERRVGLRWLGQRRQRFIGADVEGPQDHRSGGHRRGHRGQDVNLLGLRREPLRAKEEKFAAQQADAVGSRGGGSLRVFQTGGVATDFDSPAVAGHGRGRIGEDRGRTADRPDGVGRRIDQNRPLVAIE